MGIPACDIVQNVLPLSVQLNAVLLVEVGCDLRTRSGKSVLVFATDEGSTFAIHSGRSALTDLTSDHATITITKQTNLRTDRS